MTNEEWIKYNIRINLMLKRDKDADIINFLNKSANKTELIKVAIRYYMANK